jgi:DNA replication protein DnaC
MSSPSATTPATAPLVESLDALGLRWTAENLDDLVARATRGRWSPAQIVEEVAKQEALDRTRRSVERRLRRARVGRFKPMSDFDWNWPKHIDREAVERALSLEFLDRAENVVLVAAQGLGKTMIAKNLCHAAVLAGHTALFITAADLLLDLSKQETGRTLERRVRSYARPRLLAIDEVGYLAYDNHAADHLFQIVSQRYEHRSLVVTTNLPFADWSTAFPNAACATALIDRLTHHAEIISVDGQSYRRREAESARKTRQQGKRA